MKLAVSKDIWEKQEIRLVPSIILGELDVTDAGFYSHSMSALLGSS